MKKVIMLIVLMFPVLLIAQDVTPPEDWMEVVTNLNTWFYDLAGLAALTVFTASFLNRILTIIGSGWKQLVALVVGFLLAGLANLVNLGFFADLTLLQTVAYGIGAGFISNGIFDLNFVRSFLQFVGLEKKVE